MAAGLLTEGLLQELLQLTDRAGKAILPFWKTNLCVNSKADQSPVTEADMAAHRVLLEGLQNLTPSVPVLSEEASDIPLTERRGWERWWLVDPLDGTKEFIAGSDEFTVNLALIEAGQVVFGIVGVPAQSLVYYGGTGQGSWCLQAGRLEALRVRQPALPLRVLGSRRHSSPEQERVLRFLRSQGEVELISVGSSLKFCWLAQGRADLYPRFAPTSQWDTAAAQAVLEGAGGEVLDVRGERLLYPARENFLNPFFFALPKDSAWRDSLINFD